MKNDTLIKTIMTDFTITENKGGMGFGYLGYTFNLDEEVETTERVIMTIWDALAATGGMMGFAFIVVDIIIGGAQTTLYYSQLIKKVFFIDASLQGK